MRSVHTRKMADFWQQPLWCFNLPISTPPPPHCPGSLWNHSLRMMVTVKISSIAATRGDRTDLELSQKPSSQRIVTFWPLCQLFGKTLFTELIFIWPNSELTHWENPNYKVFVESDRWVFKNCSCQLPKEVIPVAMSAEKRLDKNLKVKI